MSIEMHRGFPVVHATNRAQWRNWLQQHHESERSVWLVIPNKNSQAPGIGYAEAVEEALCFGWIDSTAWKRDTESKYQFFARRKPKSNWSRLNRERIEQLTAQGLMTPAGQALVDLAKKTGTWTALEDPQNAVLPADLARALKKSRTAHRHFEAFPPSSKRMILEWIQAAKRPETRQKRIEETVTLAADNIRAHHPKRKDPPPDATSGI